MHAAIDFILLHPETSANWHELSNTIVVMSSSPEELQALCLKSEERKVKSAVFREPDMADRLTAICLEPSREAKRLTSCYRLALRAQ